MSIIKINAITVPADAGDELAQRFAARAGAVDDQDGFEGFELLKPTDDRTTWLVVTRWRDEAAFEAWVSSPAFGHGHRSGADMPAPATVVRCRAQLGAVVVRGGVGRPVRGAPRRPALTPHGVLLDFHEAFAWFVIIANGLAGLWALGANWFEPLRTRALWWFIMFAELTIFVQVAMGVGW